MNDEGYDQKSPPLFSIRESWKMDETAIVVAIVRDVECWRLAHFDGCVCSSFQVRDVHVEISCGKGSPQGVRVYSKSADFDDKSRLQPIMDEVLRQLRETSGRVDNWAQSFEEPK